MVGIYSWIKRATERSKKKKKIKKSIPQIMLWTYYCILLLTSHLISSHHSHNKSLFCYAIRNGDGVDRNKLTFGNFVWVLEEGLKICAILRNNICYGWLTMSNVEFDRLLVLYGTYPAGRGGQQEEILNPECIWALFSMCQSASFEYYIVPVQSHIIDRSSSVLTPAKPTSTNFPMFSTLAIADTKENQNTRH